MFKNIKEIVYIARMDVPFVNIISPRIGLDYPVNNKFKGATKMKENTDCKYFSLDEFQFPLCDKK